MAGGAIGDFHIAQFNIARMRAPLESPLMADFLAALDPINARADAAPGFVWRLKTDAGNAVSLHPYGDPLIIVNLSVWQSIESWHAFVYTEQHAGVMANRKQWFEPLSPPYLVLWWLPAGKTPTVEQGMAKAGAQAES